MKNKYLLAIILVLILSTTYLVVKYYNASKEINSMQKLDYIYDSISNLDNTEKDKLINKAYPVKNVSLDEKRNIAMNFFEEYINMYKTNWNQAKGNGAKIEIVFSEYKIKNADFVSEEGNKFTFCITYDIKCANNNNYWTAGNGHLEDDGWVKDKVQYIDIIKYKDKYYLDSIYTG